MLNCVNDLPACLTDKLDGAVWLALGAIDKLVELQKQLCHDLNLEEICIFGHLFGV